MASSKEMVDYVCDQLSGAGEILTKRMFGEWGLYRGGVYFGCVCGNQLFINPTANNVDPLAHPEPAAPYEGAKPCWRIGDLEGREALAALVERTCAELGQGRKKRSGQEEVPWTEKDC